MLRRELRRRLPAGRVDEVDDPVAVQDDGVPVGPDRRRRDLGPGAFEGALPQPVAVQGPESRRVARRRDDEAVAGVQGRDRSPGGVRGGDIGEGSRRRVDGDEPRSPRVADGARDSVADPRQRRRPRVQRRDALEPVPRRVHDDERAALVARGHARARVDGHGREAHAGVRGGRPILQHAHDAVGRRPRRAPGRPQAAGAGLLAARDRSGRGHSRLAALVLVPAAGSGSPMLSWYRLSHFFARAKIRTELNGLNSK